MKKILTVAAFTILGFASMNAQDLNYGLKGGINIATATGDNSSSFDAVTAFHIGAMAEIKLTEKFSFQPEVLFSGQGTSFNDDIIELRYINVPLMAKYYVAKGLSLEAGPQVGFLVSAKYLGNDVKDNLAKVDLGLNVGLGYKLDNGLNFGARYNFGLSDVNEIKGLNDSNKNSVFQFSVGYFFL
ncbi:porin family protein [Flavobacterium antarcticum]|uniref:porin family protein n=1 Tax=Flavobacterium antarcticum TaxID=271155 RepID=UPI0003B74FFA|nr:porin family protein [Flavobacterium antarcticum]